MIYFCLDFILIIYIYIRNATLNIQKNMVTIFFESTFTPIGREGGYHLFYVALHTKTAIIKANNN